MHHIVKRVPSSFHCSAGPFCSKIAAKLISRQYTLGILMNMFAWSACQFKFCWISIFLEERFNFGIFVKTERGGVHSCPDPYPAPRLTYPTWSLEYLLKWRIWQKRNSPGPVQYTINSPFVYLWPLLLSRMKCIRFFKIILVSKCVKNALNTDFCLSIELKIGLDFEQNKATIVCQICFLITRIKF